MLFLLCLSMALLATCITHWVYRWRNPKCNGVLPPGSMGLPIIGESLEYFSPHKNDNIPPFIRKRMLRYGQIFRTSLVGQPVIVSTDPEVNHYVFQQEGIIFQCWYTESVNKILGKQSMVVHQGAIHKYLKMLISTLVSPERLKEKLIDEMDENTRKHICSWARLGHVEARDAAAEMIFDFGAKKLLSYDETKASRKLRENYNAFLDGLISFPLNIPGTAYHRCIQGRKNAIEVIKDAYNERRTLKGKYQDFMDYLVREVEKEDTFLTESVAIDLVFLLLFVFHETTSAAMAMAIKFLHHHPSALEELTKEHEEIVMSRGNKEAAITWKEYKSMTFTHMVINETVRLANIAPGIFRKVMKEVEIKGYTIPAGWILMVCPSSVHLNPEKYEDPLAFNPWRWKKQELHSASKHFMAFGGGQRFCVGAPFAQLQMAIFLHYLVTKYRWTITHGGETVRKPGLYFPNGLHVEISEK